MHSRLVGKDPKKRFIFFLQKSKQNIESTKAQQYIEVCKYYRHALSPEISCPPGARVSAMAQTDTDTHRHKSQTLQRRD